MFSVISQHRQRPFIGCAPRVDFVRIRIDDRQLSYTAADARFAITRTKGDGLLETLHRLKATVHDIERHAPVIEGIDMVGSQAQNSIISGQSLIEPVE